MICLYGQSTDAAVIAAIDALLHTDTHTRTPAQTCILCVFMHVTYTTVYARRFQGVWDPTVLLDGFRFDEA